MEIQSTLFPLLFERLDCDRRLTVFDVGPAMPETLDFFAQFKCRLYFADLFAEWGESDQISTMDADALQRRFQALLAYPAKTQFDICLFWDFFNYLDPLALRAFDGALRPFVGPAVRGHGFNVLDNRKTLTNQRYSVRQLDKLAVTQSGDQPVACHPHSTEELKKSLACFNVGRGRLLSDGRLELYLQAASP